MRITKTTLQRRIAFITKFYNIPIALDCVNGGYKITNTNGNTDYSNRLTARECDVFLWGMVAENNRIK